MIKRVCESCSMEFNTWPYVVKAGNGRYCSRKCHHKVIGSILSRRALASRSSVKYEDGYALIQVGLRSAMKVSVEDAKLLSEMPWSIAPGNYAYRRVGSRKIHAHRVVVERVTGRELSSVEHVDHINHDTLDNRRQNLRPCLPSQNQTNKEITKRNTSGFKGVTLCKSTMKWRMSVGGRASTGKQIRFGRFEDREYAANMYDQFASQIFGEFAVLNFTYE